MISREDLVEQSVNNWVRAGLVARGYDGTRVEFRESFPYKLAAQQLDRTIVALGFNLDDQGEQAEMGSDLKRRVYTIEMFVFGVTATYARNVANVLKFVLEREGSIPLVDIAEAAQPIVGQLEVLGASAQRQVVADPEPWQEHVWTTTLRVEDTYRASLV